jgi:hypothetical protein
MGVVDCAACDGTGRTSGMICWFCHGLCAWSTVAPRQPGSTGSGRDERVSARSVLVAPARPWVLLGRAAGVASVGGASAAAASEHAAACPRTACRMS